MPTTNNVVLGTAVGFSEDDLKPFVISIRDSGYAGLVCLFCDRTTAAKSAWIDPYKIKMIPIDEKYPFAKAFKPNPQDDPELMEEASIHVRRYPLYRMFLQQQGSVFQRVLFTDVRDVVFQREPFAYQFPDADLWFVFEDQSMTIGKCAINSLWTREVFGEEVLKGLSRCKISCSGTVYGTYAGIMDYLDAMISEFIARRVTHHDQAVHNYLIHTGVLSRYHVFSNEAGPVLTLHHRARALKTNARRELLNDKGDVALLVHQYDRDLVLSWRIQARYISLRSRMLYLANRIRWAGHRELRDYIYRIWRLHLSNLAYLSSKI